VGLIPYWLTGWRFEPFWTPLRVVGALITVAAVAVVISAFVQFVVEGIGTPAPVAETQYLVVKGLYRYVRNPIYIALISAIAGQALLFGQLGLLVYAAIAGATLVGFVKVYEEPRLAERFGDEYEAYCQTVPGWWPRLHSRPLRPRP
jgi:protein-S-isoprenylcysteine O-methyltransferase Ste14